MTHGFDVSAVDMDVGQRKIDTAQAALGRCLRREGAN